MSKIDDKLIDVGAVPALSGDAARAVVAALTRDGADVRFVGGCVRDLLLGEPLSDVDLATPDRPETIVALLEAGDIKAVPTGLKHGTVTAVAKGVPFEITTLRIDVETDGRHAEVAFTDDWEADAARRDFTINAMSLTPDGSLFDYFEGRCDLARQCVRFVGNARTRISEDYLRVLRFFRFLAQLPAAQPDEAAVDACREAAGRLGGLSAERIQAELLKLLKARNPVPAIELMRGTGVLEAMLPEAGSSVDLMALSGIDDGDPVRRLAALAPDGGAAIAHRLKMSNDDKARLSQLAPPALSLDVAATAQDVRQVIYDIGSARVRDMILLGWSADREGRAAAWRAMMEVVNAWESPELPIKGADAVSLGLKSGPDVGEALRAVERWWRSQDFQPDREVCMAVLRHHLGSVR